MKQLTTFIIFALTALPGCGTKEKKDQPKTETHAAPELEKVFHYIENPNDTILPTKSKSRDSDLDTINEPAESEIIK